MPAPHPFFATVLVDVHDPVAAVDPQLSSFSASIVRPRDLLVLDLEFINLERTPTGRLKRAKPNRRAFIVAHFQAQSIGEGSQDETEPAPPVPTAPTTPVPSQIAAPTRLVFEVPKSLQPRYAVRDLLRFMRNRAPATIEPSGSTGTPSTAPPPPITARIEIPLGLALEPAPQTRWTHTSGLVTRDERTELWHTRLGVQGVGGVNEVTPTNRTARATNLTEPGDSLVTELQPDDLEKIAGLSRAPGQSPIRVNRLMLTALGAWLDAKLVRDEGVQTPGNNLLEWEHRATLGRDHFVRRVEAGFLVPFGHRATLVTITERKLARAQDDSLVASLFTRRFVVVKEPVKQFDPLGLAAAGVSLDRRLPLARVRVRTLVTPLLDPPESSPVTTVAPSDEAFWVRVAGQDFRFALEAVDVASQTVQFNLPMIFVAENVDLILKVPLAYNLEPAERRVGRLYGQRLAFAPSAQPADTTFETTGVTFNAAIPDNPPPEVVPKFRPLIRQADVGIPAIKQLLGAPADRTIAYYTAYLNDGFAGANRGQVFLSLVNSSNPALPAPLPLGFAPDKAGGVAAPNMNVGGLSRTFGPVGGDPGQLAAGSFNPAQFFDSSARLLGDIRLADVIPTPGAAEFAGAVPKLNVQHLTNAAGQAVIQTGLTWTTRAAAPPTSADGIPSNPDVPLVTRPSSTLTVTSTVTRLVDNPLASEFRTVGTLEDVDLNLLGLIVVKFSSLQFTSVSGQKLQVDANISGVEFGGPLEFVNKLQEYLPTSGKGFDDPPFLDVSPSGVDVGYTLGLPPIAVGMMSIQNVGLTAGLFLPFLAGSTTLRFMFSERHNPFILTVSIFGGGGFFGLGVTTKGVQRIEAALEFGAAVALNLVVASGAVTIMAGFYFIYAIDTDILSLNGYLRASGVLEVLGILSISIEFRLDLFYPYPMGEDTGKIGGKASLVVKVKLLFFSKKVSVEMERQFAGSAGDPAIGEVVSPTQWQTYCAAFDPDA